MIAHLPISDSQILLIAFFSLLFLYLVIIFVQKKVYELIETLEEANLAKYMPEDKSKFR